MRKTRRVVVTGLGVVAPNGIGKDAFWQNLIAGKSAVDWITAFDPTPFPCRIAAEVKNFRPEEFMSRRQAKEIWRFSQFAVASARMAQSVCREIQTERTDRSGATGKRKTGKK